MIPDLPSMTILLVMLYFLLGVLACVYLYATWQGWTQDRQEKIDRAGCFVLMIPELGILVAILVLLFWPVYVLLRLRQLVLK
jgi:hypothetical protein